MKILVIHGPHLSLLGKISATNKIKLTLSKIDRFLRKLANEQSVDLKIYQQFSRKNILKILLSNRNAVDGIILNLGGMGRDFYALQEYLAIIKLPVVEITLSEFPFSKITHQKSAIKKVAEKRIYKKGLSAYEEALDFFTK